MTRPNYLAAVPLDPYVGGPLRFRRLEDGVVIYALGPDGQDNGGRFRRRGELATNPGWDVGFRLWDVAQRRQPAPIVAKPDPDDKE